MRALLTSEVEPFLQNILPSGSSGGSEASVNQAPNGADAGPSGAQNSSSWTEDSFGFIRAFSRNRNGGHVRESDETKGGAR